MQSSPWNVLSSQISAGVLTEGWQLDAVDHADVDAVRSYSVSVDFVTPFATAPVVQLSLTGFDLDQRDSARLTVKAENISPSGFQAVISTWADTRVYGVELQWFAIGA